MEKKVLNDRFKSTNKVKEPGQSDSPSGISKFFSAIFFCGTDRDQERKGDGGCFGGKPVVDDENEGNSHIPTQSL